MSRLHKQKKENIGLSPDALIFKGVQKIDQTEIDCIYYNGTELDEFSLMDFYDITPQINKKGVLWINIYGVHDAKIMDEISQLLNIEHFILAEVMDTYSRPKMMDYEEGIYLNMKMLQYDLELHRIDEEQISMIFNDSIIITFQEKRGDLFDAVRDRIRKSKKRMRLNGPDYLAYALLDTIIDHYNYIVSIIGDEIEQNEVNLFEEYTEDQLNIINRSKKEIHFLRKTIKPMRENVLQLQKPDLEMISKKVKIHFRELLTNINHANESADAYREILNDQLNIYHTNMTSKLNDVMKFLTIFSVIFIPLTFIAGIYGTNFEYIPELQYPSAYFIMLGVMLIIAIFMIFYFKKRKWLR